MNEQEEKQVHGLREYEDAVKHLYSQNYAEASASFKGCLKSLKMQQKDKTLAYLYVLKRLAYSSFKDRQYEESEKYFKVSNSLSEIVT